MYSSNYPRLVKKYEKPEDSLANFKTATLNIEQEGVERFADTVFLIDLEIAAGVFARIIALATNTKMACEMRLLPDVPKWLPLIAASEPPTAHRLAVGEAAP